MGEIEIINYFLHTLNKFPESLWIKCNKIIVSNKLYMAGIYKDIELFKKYCKGNVLDFGVGAGYTSLLLSKSYQVNAVEFKDFMINTELYHNVNNDQPKLWSIFEKDYNIKFNYYTKKLQFENNKFDGITAFAVLEHIPDQYIPNTLNELNRILKPNGILFINRLPRKLSWTEHFSRLLGYNSHESLYGDNEIKEILKRHNFTVIKQIVTDMLPFYPMSITNRFFSVLSILNKILLFTPLKLFAHNITIIAKKG